MKKTMSCGPVQAYISLANVALINGLATVKFLIVVSLLQTAAILFLAIRLADGNRAPAPRADSALPAAQVATATPAVTVRSAEAQINVDDIRRIVAEELRAHLGALPAASAVAIEDGQDTGPGDAERLSRVDLVSQRIDYYRSVGRMSAADMQLLQQQMARLDPRDRQRMLNELVQSMNAGEIDGDL